eukprot:GHRR01015428.1.p2 GENE.GHRR01015428.1~~GHRR01015428.1.p2  ORF type:complete len:116 (+),score=13.89 GHRR01015428.1:90-437(+)
MKSACRRNSAQHADQTHDYRRKGVHAVRRDAHAVISLPAIAISSLLSFTPRVPSASSCSTTQLNAASLAAKWVRTTCCSSYLDRLQGNKARIHKVSVVLHQHVHSLAAQPNIGDG